MICTKSEGNPWDQSKYTQAGPDTHIKLKKKNPKEINQRASFKFWRASRENQGAERKGKTKERVVTTKLKIYLRHMSYSD